LRASGIRAVQAGSHLVVVDDVPCRARRDAEGGLVIAPSERGLVTFLSGSTRFSDLTADEKAALPEIAAASGESLIATADSIIERKLFALRLAPLASALLERNRAAERQRQEAEEAERRRRQKLEEQLLQALERQAQEGVPVAVEDGEFVYDGVNLGVPTHDGEAIWVKIAGGRVAVSGATGTPDDAIDRAADAVHGLRAAADVLERLGVRSSVSRQGLCVDGSLVARPTQELPSEDQLVAEYALDELAEHVGGQLRGQTVKSVDVRADPRRRVVTVYRGSSVIGHVSASSASVDEIQINGDFTLPRRRGTFGRDERHWRDLAAALSRRIEEKEEEERREEAVRAQGVAAAVDAQARRARAEARTVMDDREELPESVREECLRASEDIRLRRTAAFNHPVMLIADRFRITFQPIESVGAQLVVPFRYEHEETSLSATLRISGNSDPLALTVRGEVAKAEIPRAWAAALLGFAQLTVLPEFVQVRRGRPREHSMIRTHRTRRTEPPQRRFEQVRTRYVGRGGLIPVGWTATAQWVVGHVRVLPEGRSASMDAEREAAAVGITLAPGET
jgi:hypothetical protein